MQNNNNKGFSLIELSIVLIIIGLLVAGITGGASLIKSAELRSTMSEIRNYQTAVNSYYTEKGYLPGTTQGQTDKVNLFASDASWGELYDAGITDFKATTATAGKYVAGTNMPKAKVKGAGYLLGYLATAETTTGNAVNANSILLVGSDTTVGATLDETIAAANLKASTDNKTAKALDDKMDDGLPKTGKMIALKGTCQATDAYDTATGGTLCAQAMKIGL